MRRYRVVGLLLLILFSMKAAVALSAENIAVPYVYRIKSDNCTHAPVARRQTGFRVVGTIGMITALHGVADCTTISAIADDGGEIFTELVITAVDIERDIALLSTPELAKLPAQGLAPTELSTTTMLTATLHVVGYPLGLEKQDIDAIERVRAIESLDDVIPDSEESVEFLKRNSPSIRVDVLNLQVQLLPGHSGAPVLDDQDRLVAIGDGGLRGGTVARSWAMLWQDVELRPVADDRVQKALTALAAKEVSALSLSSTYPTHGEEETETATYPIRVVDDHAVPIANAEVLLTHREGYEVGFTDSEGFYLFHLVTSVTDDQHQIQVEASGYERYSRTIGTILGSVDIEILQMTTLQPTATATPTARPTPSPTSPPVVTTPQICSFAFLVLDAQTEEPIKKATISVILGVRQDSGATDSTGYYLAKLPCDNAHSVEAHIRIFADEYVTYNRTVFLIGQTIDILLEQKVPPTPTATPTPPRPTATSTPEQAALGIGDWVEAVASLRIREYPGTHATVLETLPRDEVFRIHDGPEEADELRWWQLSEIDGTIRGWAAYVVDDEGPSLQRVPAQRATPAPTRTAPQPTETKALLEIIAPDWGESISGQVEIRWRYAGTLGPNQGFDLVLWYPKEPKRWGIVDAKELAQKLVNHGNGEYSVSLNVSSAPSVEHYCDASYLLYVTVIQVEPYARTGPESDMVDVRVRPISGVCG